MQKNAYLTMKFQLLVAIKDTNDHLVAITLRTLADLVPVLGAATIIGGKRAKLFNDGRPITHSNRRSLKVVSMPQEIEQPAPTTPEVLQNQINVNTIAIESNNLVTLPERSRPDGEEGETSTEEVEQSVDEDLDNWEDWDINENNPNSNNLFNTIEDTIENVPDNLNQNIVNEVTTFDNTMPQRNLEKSKRTIPDIGELDIKNQLNKDENDDFDFFQDMEPVINTTSKFLISESDSDVILNIDKEVSHKLALNDNDIHEEGWGNGDWE